VKIEQLSQAHAIERAEKEVQRLREVLEKSRSLHAEGFYATDRLKQDERDYEQAVNDLAKARLDKQVYEEYTYKKDEKQKRSDVEEAKAELERVERQNASRLASKAAERDNRREVLAQRQRLMQKYEQQLERATIAAPAAGLVVYASSMEQNRWGDDSGPLQVGSKVWANQTLIILPDTSEMVAAVRVHESMAGRIRRGQRTSVKVDAFGEQRFPGVVESIGILAESTGGWRDPDRKEYTVRVVLDREAVAQAAGGDDAPGADGSSSMSDGGGTNDRRGLKPSMRAEAEIILGSVEDAVAVPIQAVFNEGVMRFVHVRDGSSGRFVKRPVLVGRRSDRFAEILGGLVASEQVLLRKPEPGELSNRAPDATELAAAGLTLDESGRIIAVPRPAPSGGRRLQGPGGPGGPGGNEPAASRGKPAAVPVIATPAKPAGEPVTDTPAATTSAPAGESAAPAKQ
jgi:HlyD family secretion protein